MREQNPLKIYIAAPYSAETNEQQERNARMVVDLAITLYKEGHFPYAPHLTHWVDKVDKENGGALNWSDYMSWHKPWLESCDALLYMGASKGADIELEVAKHLRKRIFYSLDEIPAVEEGRC